MIAPSHQGGGFRDYPNEFDPRVEVHLGKDRAPRPWAFGTILSGFGFNKRLHLSDGFIGTLVIYERFNNVEVNFTILIVV